MFIGDLAEPMNISGHGTCGMTRLCLSVTWQPTKVRGLRNRLIHFLLPSPFSLHCIFLFVSSTRCHCPLRAAEASPSRRLCRRTCPTAHRGCHHPELLSRHCCSVGPGLMPCPPDSTPPPPRPPPPDRRRYCPVGPRPQPLPQGKPTLLSLFRRRTWAIAAALSWS
jgi:hypothetical protein